MLVVWISFIIGLANCLPVGVQVSLSIKAVEEFKDKALPSILASIGEVEVSPISKSSSLRTYAFKADLTNILMGDIGVNAADSEVQFNSPNEIDVSLRQLRGEGSFAYSVSCPLGKGQGLGKVSLNDARATMRILLEEVDHRLRVIVDYAIVTIDDLQVELSGSTSAAVVSWFLDIFKHELELAFSKQLDAALATSMQAFLDNMLVKAPLFIPLWDNAPLAMDYSLPMTPVVSADHLELYSHGAIFELEQPAPDRSCIIISGLPAYDPLGASLQVAVSEFTINSGLWAAVDAGLVTFTLTEEMLKGDSPMHFNADILNAFLRGIKAIYGADKLCEVVCRALKYPSISLVSDSLQGIALFDCSLEVLGAGKSALDFDIWMDFTGSFKVIDWTLVGGLEDVELSSVQITSCAIGILSDPVTLKNLLSGALNRAKPAINKAFFGEGVALPAVDGVDMQNSAATIGEKYVLAEATPTYKFVGDINGY